MWGRGTTGRGWTPIWRSGFRVVVGAYWLYFATQKWDPGYRARLQVLIGQSAQVNPIPGLHEFLTQVATPHAQLFLLFQTGAETVVGLLLVAGIATRPAAVLATLLAINLSLTVAFLDTDIGARWLYYLPIAASFEVAVSGPGAVALGRLREFRNTPTWIRS